MTWVMVDVETDGPIPGDYSIIAIGAVIVEPGLTRTFFAKLQPISDAWMPEALQVCGFTREQALGFPEPAHELQRFCDWLADECQGSPCFVSDNNGFDWSFINWYFHHFLGRNPFGHSSTNLGSLYKGMIKSVAHNFKHLRTSAHSHNPVADARGNAEALLTMHERLGLKIEF